ncbi:MAG: TIR domain-containing protein [Cyanothece sp. SIO1E1]|nr:TIR domain-containing protein [Cyanothece sp. SIO1E1]
MVEHLATNDFQDAFISYGRADSKVFAIKLRDHLTQQGLKVWFDTKDIPLGVNYQNQIDDAIEKAHNFLFIISPHAVNSPYCAIETQLAVKCNKRIIPLMHVEEIDYKLWKQRNPGGNPDEWRTYKAQGKHASLPNMDRAIRQINWINFREGIDDFDQALAGLLEIFERQQEYVHQHTYFLTKALEWERNQHQARSLLVGDEREQAQEWLAIRFKNEQSPCLPTDLHCEFICESIKNANNLMTQVFLSYSEQDHATTEKIRKTLMRESFTLWSSRTDIQPGKDFQEEINRGIEEADNLVYLISWDSLQSTYCQQEINYALKLNKRIIPLLIESIDLEKIPSELRSLQFIDFTSHENEIAHRQAADKLLKSLNEDAAYYTAQKILLTKALKWERQKYNPSILLRGYNLRHSEAWLRVGQQLERYGPILLQEEFVAASLAQPPNQTLDVFISYSRFDSEFVRKLNNTLQIQGQTTWFDQESIAAGDDFQREIYQGIERSNNFLFIISPSSVDSSDCMDALGQAQKLNKRIVSVLYQDIPSAALPPALARIKGIDFRHHRRDFLARFGELIRTLESDPDHVRTHTRLLVKAMEWQASVRDDSFLLWGKDLTDSEQWCQHAQDKDPQPTDLQRQYLKASRELRFRKIKLRSVLLTSAVMTVLVLIARFFGLLQPAELRAYDHLMRSRPSEEPDDRLLIIEVDPPSSELIKKQVIDDVYEPWLGTVPDQALEQLLAALEPHQPRVIGLDFYRDFKVDPEAPGLADRLQQTQNLIGLCKNGADVVDAWNQAVQGYLPPPEIPLERIGFNDFAPDGEKFIRRHYLGQDADPDACDTEAAFSLVVANKYLASEGYTYTPAPRNEQDEFVGDMAFDNTFIPQLYGNGSGYQNIDDRLKGYQTLLNYRTYQANKLKDPNKFAQVLSLEAVLDGKFSEDDVKDRIVLIGYTDRADKSSDYWNTPYGEISGLFLQGQMVSQLLSAVLDGRRLIWWWSFGGEAVWIFGWSMVGGLVFWWFIRPLWLAGAVVVSLIGLYGTCYVVLVSQSGWIPLVPAAIALFATGAGVASLTYYLRRP